MENIKLPTLVRTVAAQLTGLMPSRKKPATPEILHCSDGIEIEIRPEGITIFSQFTPEKPSGFCTLIRAWEEGPDGHHRDIFPAPRPAGPGLT